MKFIYFCNLKDVASWLQAGLLVGGILGFWIDDFSCFAGAIFGESE